MIRYKKIIAAFALLVVCASPAFAVAPIVIAAAEMAAWAAAGSLFDRGVEFKIPNEDLKKYTSDGKHGKATTTGVKRNLLAKIGPYAALAVTGFIAYDDLRSFIGNPSTTSGQEYPGLSEALYKGTVPPADFNQIPYVGLEFVANGRKYKINYVSSLKSGSSTYAITPYTSTGPQTDGTFVFVGQTGNASACPYCYTGYRTYAHDLGPFVSYENRPDSEVAPYIYSPTLSDLYPEILPSIDKAIEARPDLLQFPSTLQSDILNAQKQLATDSIAESTAKKIDSLKSVRDAAQAKYDANPTPENKAALDKAEADLAAAEKEAAEDELTAIKEKELEDKLAEEKQAEEDMILTPPEPPELLHIDLTPLVGVGDDLSNKFPFTLLDTLRNFANGLVSEPAAPVFTISFPAPFNYDWTFDCSRFDGIAQMVRVLIGMAFLAYCTMFLIRRWH